MDFGDKGRHQDLLDLSFFNFGVTAETFSAWKAAHVKLIGSKTIVTIDDASSVTLHKVKAYKLGHDDFLF
jgi:hypothetical protein